MPQDLFESLKPAAAGSVPITRTREAAGEEARAPKAGRSSRRRGGPVLGVYVTPNTVYGTLLRESGDHFGVVRRFTRQRMGVATPDMAGVTAETGPTTDASGDVTIQFGDAGGLGADDLFLASEFGDIGGADGADFEPDFPSPRQQPRPVVFELKDILDECAAAGYEKPPLAFCVGAPDVDYVELVVPAERKGDRGRKADKRAEGREDEEALGEVRRDRLVARLAEVYDEPFEKERVAFVPMTPRDGALRYLAIVPTAEEAMVESLDLLREQGGMRGVPYRLLDAEVPVLVGLARWAFPAEPHENTAIVRVGAEDTLVILLQGSELHHQEHLRSVTTLDGPDTICSRVLLQQDVQGIGTVHQVIVLSEEREQELVRGFAAFYPDAQVEALREGLVRQGLLPPGSEQGLSARALPAAGAALRLFLDREKERPFEDVNLLPKRLRRRSRKIDLAVAWHTLLMGVLVFFSVLFFMGLYFGQEAEIAEARARVAAYPAELSMSPGALQAQIDSLQNVYVQINRTLNTIDSLLVGSDTWSRMLEKTARTGAATGGTWVQEWSPAGASLQLRGAATTRDAVVQFAQRMGGAIQELRFSEVREMPVYDFLIDAPVPRELPEVAKYLREQVESPFAPEPEPLADTVPLAE